MGLRRNIFSGVILAIGNGLVTLISYPLYLKYLGTELYGFWITISIVVGFTAMGSLGIDVAMTKYVAEEYGRKNKSGIKRYFSTAVVILLISSTVISFILFLFRGFIVDVLNISERYVPIANTLLPSMVILSIFVFEVKVTTGTLKGLGVVDLANYYDLGGKFISIITTIILLNFGYGVWSLFWGQVLFYIILELLAFFTIYRKFGTLFLSIGSFDLKYLKKIIGFGGTMTAAQLISMFLRPFNRLVIAKYVNLSGVTYLEIADKVVMQIRSPFDLGISAIVPEISRLSVSENAKIKIDNVSKKAMGLVLYFGVPAFIVLFLSCPFLLRLWLSSQYMPEITNALRIILAGFVTNLLISPIYYLFLGIGKVSYCLVNHLVQSILNVVLIFISIALGLASFYLFVGIYSLSVAISAILLIILFLIYRKVGFKKIL